MRYVYIIRSQRKPEKIYVGVTSNIAKRVLEHNQLKSKFTSKYRPWKLVYFESYTSSAEAYRREVQLKKWSRAKKEALIGGDFVGLKLLARRKR